MFSSCSVSSRYEQAADLIVGVRQESGVHLGHPAEQAALVVGQRVPRAVKSTSGNGSPSGPVRVCGSPIGLIGGSSSVFGDQAELLLARQRLLAHRLVAHVEPALVLLDPLLRHLVRRMTRPGRVVQAERLVRRHRLGVLDELKRPIGQVHRQVIALLRLIRLIDRMIVIDQVRMPLVGLRAEEPVEALEPAPRRPVAPRRGQVHLVGRAQMPLARHVRVPAKLAEDLRQHPVLRWDRPARVRKADRRFGDAGHAVARVVATRQQARAGRRAQRGRVPLRIAHPARRSGRFRRVDRAAVTADAAKPTSSSTT